MQVTTGAPMVMFGTKCPSIMSMCSQSAPSDLMIREHSCARLPKSEARIEGAMMGFGAISNYYFWVVVVVVVLVNWDGS